MCRVCGQLVLLKENWTNDAQSYREFVIQHDVYQGAFFESAVPDNPQINLLNDTVIYELRELMLRHDFVEVRQLVKSSSMGDARYVLYRR